jgi:hypothetical protein
LAHEHLHADIDPGHDAAVAGREQGGLQMVRNLSHPAIALALLAAVSGTLGSYVPGDGYGEAPGVGVYLVLAGVWFALVVGFGVWLWGSRSAIAAGLAFAATWVGWELAVNLAMQLDQHWLKATALPSSYSMHASGFLAGAVGAFCTWAGTAASCPALRRPSVPTGIVAAGSVLGLLLPLTNTFDNPAVLLVPWQIAVASLIGRGLVSTQSLGSIRHNDDRPLSDHTARRAASA